MLVKCALCGHQQVHVNSGFVTCDQCSHSYYVVCEDNPELPKCPECGKRVLMLANGRCLHCIRGKP